MSKRKSVCQAYEQRLPLLVVANKRGIKRTIQRAKGEPVSPLSVIDIKSKQKQINAGESWLKHS